MVKAKKHLGQHFLKDEGIALNIADALVDVISEGDVIEIGPGTGVLSKYLIDKTPGKLWLIDLDQESIDYLHKHYSKIKETTFYGDFLKNDLSFVTTDKFHVIGNFPYNISSQIFFKILDFKNRVEKVVGMLQYEVAKRLASPPGNKDYGILSVLLQAYYDIEYLFDVEAYVFDPPPKVRSGVIRLVRNKKQSLDCDEILFKSIVKQGFQNRRKTLRNALKPLNLPDEVKSNTLLERRAETLSVDDFVYLTKEVEKWSS